jgi:Pvc16 N-terminal domain
MSAAVGDASETLIELLRAELDDLLTEPQLQIALVSPPEAVQAGNVRLSVFLYSMTPVAEMRNDPEISLSFTDTALPPLPLDLYYLLTAFPPPPAIGTPTERALDAHRLLGAAMRVLHDNGTLTGSALRGALPRNEELRVTFQPITVEDLTRIWSVFPNTALQPSVSYLLTPVKLGSDRRTVSQRVVDRQVDFDLIARRPDAVET